jgi:hypothetical protein
MRHFVQYARAFYVTLKSGAELSDAGVWGWKLTLPSVMTKFCVSSNFSFLRIFICLWLNLVLSAPLGVFVVLLIVFLFVFWYRGGMGLWQGNGAFNHLFFLVGLIVWRLQWIQTSIIRRAGSVRQCFSEENYSVHKLFKEEAAYINMQLVFVNLGRVFTHVPWRCGP